MVASTLLTRRLFLSLVLILSLMMSRTCPLAFLAFFSFALADYKSNFAHPHGWRWFSFACHSQPSNNCLILETDESTYGTASKRPCK